MILGMVQGRESAYKEISISRALELLRPTITERALEYVRQGEQTEAILRTVVASYTKSLREIIHEPLREELKRVFGKRIKKQEFNLLQQIVENFIQQELIAIVLSTRSFILNDAYTDFTLTQMDNLMGRIRELTNSNPEILKLLQKIRETIVAYTFVIQPSQPSLQIRKIYSTQYAEIVDTIFNSITTFIKDSKGIKKDFKNELLAKIRDLQRTLRRFIVMYPESINTILKKQNRGLTRVRTNKNTKR
jgi:lauroyl/myristoyl acyltransferase